MNLNNNNLKIQMNGQEWKYYLNNKDKDSLLKKYDYDHNNLIVCHKLENMRFGIFSSHSNFNKYVINNIKDSEICFYECILGKHSRKPYFDIDIENKKIIGDDLIINLKEIIKKVLPDKYNFMILVYTSHTKTKQSYHVILNGIYFSTNSELLEFFNKVKENVKVEYKQYLDFSVYSNIRQFRLLGSHKFGKNNKKIFSESLSENFFIPDIYTNDIAKNNYKLRISLISNITDCVMITDFVKKPSPRRYYGYSDENDVDEIDDLIQNKFPNIFEIDQIRSDRGLLITLRKKKSYICVLCNRIHENENPYVIVKGPERSVEFICRRYQDNHKTIKSINLGKLENFDINLIDTKIKNIELFEDKQINLESKLENMRVIREENNFEIKECLKSFNLF